MSSPVNQPLVVRIPVNNHMVQRAFDMLKSRLVRRSEEQFRISTNTVNHSDIDRHISLLLEQYADVDDEVKAYIKRLKFNNEGQQFAKAIVINTKSRFSVSVVAASRRKCGINDEHKILVATMTKTVEISSSSLDLVFPIFPLNLVFGLIFPWTAFSGWLGIEIDNPLKDLLRQLNDEDSKKCLEAMTFHLLGDKIRASLDNDVEVQFIEQ
ncbi:unnamed protein product [Adineta steineri]|uniref:Uncharacterized protein n=1 Tax=Adineta steineri TaxID=433720 RepID=A0A815JNU5_9BILA|nr:unnamed protein product [Adineta steineri]CAF3866087.1 unnamed protein product [Adineta steineri]